MPTLKRRVQFSSLFTVLYDRYHHVGEVFDTKYPTAGMQHPWEAPTGSAEHWAVFFDDA